MVEPRLKGRRDSNFSFVLEMQKEQNRKRSEGSNKHHRMNVKPTTWSKKGQSVYYFSVFTSGSTSLILEVTAPASHDPGRDRHTERG